MIGDVGCEKETDDIEGVSHKKNPYATSYSLIWSKTKTIRSPWQKHKTIIAYICRPYYLIWHRHKSLTGVCYEYCRKPLLNKYKIS